MISGLNFRLKRWRGEGGNPRHPAALPSSAISNEMFFDDSVNDARGERRLGGGGGPSGRNNPISGFALHAADHYVSNFSEGKGERKRRSAEPANAGKLVLRRRLPLILSSGTIGEGREGKPRAKTTILCRSAHHTSHAACGSI